MNIPLYLQLRKLNQQVAPLHPLPVEARPFARWGLDFIGRLPPTKNGNRWLLVAIDHETDWLVLKTLTEATEDEVANFLYHEILIQYGCPTEIITDRGANFMAKTLNRYQFIIICLSILNSVDYL